MGNSDWKAWEQSLLALCLPGNLCHVMACHLCCPLRKHVGLRVGASLRSMLCLPAYKAPAVSPCLSFPFPGLSDLHLYPQFSWVIFWHSQECVSSWTCSGQDGSEPRKTGIQRDPAISGHPGSPCQRDDCWRISLAIVAPWRISSSWYIHLIMVHFAHFTSCHIWTFCGNDNQPHRSRLRRAQGSFQRQVLTGVCWPTHWNLW